MFKISKQTRETVKTILFLLMVGLLITVFVIYPLGRTKAFLGRADIDEYNVDSLGTNDGTLFSEAGLDIDTFYVETDQVTKLACIFVRPAITPIKGTVFLLHGDDSDRTSMIELASMASSEGYVAVTYDQRAVGLSSGKYRGEGQYEGTDLQAIISHLDIRGAIVRPVTVIGWDRGGDAAILASLEEDRIDRAVAIEPYLTTNQLIDHFRDKYDSYWIPFFRTVIWWWYDKRSGYAMSYRDTDNIRSVGTKTLLMVPAGVEPDETVMRLKELSDPSLLSIVPLPESDQALWNLLTAGSDQ
jgi:pimeloyl-ACP methyl ester carboxylesterase